MKTNENLLLFRIVVCLEREKLDILVCFKAPTACVCATRQVLLMVFDMASIMVRPTRICITKCFFPFSENQPKSTVERVDAIWDTITLKKIKSLTQKRRGTGVRTRLEPKQWWHHTHSQKRLSYRKNVDSKRELFSCISKRQTRDVSDKQMVKYWYENTSSEMLAELWIEFGSGKSYRYIPVHIPHQQLGLSKSLALPLFPSRLWYSTFPTFWAVARRVAGMHG